MQNSRKWCAEFASYVRSIFIFLRRNLTTLPQRDGQADSVWVVDNVWTVLVGASSKVHRWSSIPVLTKPNVEQLSCSRPTHCRYAKPLTSTTIATDSVAELTLAKSEVLKRLLCVLLSGVLSAIVITPASPGWGSAASWQNTQPVISSASWANSIVSQGTVCLSVSVLTSVVQCGPNHNHYTYRLVIRHTQTYL